MKRLLFITFVGVAFLVGSLTLDGSEDVAHTSLADAPGDVLGSVPNVTEVSRLEPARGPSGDVEASEYDAPSALANLRRSERSFHERAARYPFGSGAIETDADDRFARYKHDAVARAGGSSARVAKDRVDPGEPNTLIVMFDSDVPDELEVRVLGGQEFVRFTVAGTARLEVPLPPREEIGVATVGISFGEGSAALRTSYTVGQLGVALAGDPRSEVVDGSLHVVVPVAVERRGTYYVAATIYDVSDHAIGWSRVGLRVDEAGRSDVTLRFYGLMFHDAGATGPFRVAVQLENVSRPGVVLRGEVVHDAHHTAGFDLADFTDESFENSFHSRRLAAR